MRISSNRPMGTFVYMRDLSAGCRGIFLPSLLGSEIKFSRTKKNAKGNEISTVTTQFKLTVWVSVHRIEIAAKADVLGTNDSINCMCTATQLKFPWWFIIRDSWEFNLNRAMAKVVSSYQGGLFIGVGWGCCLRAFGFLPPYWALDACYPSPRGTVWESCRQPPP